MVVVVRGAGLSIGLTASRTACLMMGSLFVIRRTAWNLRLLEEMNARAVLRRSFRIKVPVKTRLKAIYKSWSRIKGREKMDAEVNHRPLLCMRVPKRLPLNRNLLARCSKDVGYRPPKCVFLSRPRTFRH